jgi:hypothetical protein
VSREVAVQRLYKLVSRAIACNGCTGLRNKANVIRIKALDTMAGLIL